MPILFGWELINPSHSDAAPNSPRLKEIGKALCLRSRSCRLLQGAGGVYLKKKNALTSSGWKTQSKLVCGCSMQ